MNTAINGSPLDRLMVFTGNANPRLAHLRVARLRHPREAEPLVQRLGREATG